MTLRPSALINRHKTPLPPSAAPAHSLWLWCSSLRVSKQGYLNVSEAESRAGSQYLCLRIRADGEGNRLSRIRRALAVREGNQPDGHSGAGHGARRADWGTRRQAGDRYRPRFPRLFGLDQIRADLGPDGIG